MRSSWILAILGSVAFAQHAYGHEEMPMEAFDDCIRYCSNEYGKCLKATGGMWKDYMHNRNKIARIVRRCCLKNEKNPKAKEEDSFASCAKIRCGAHLYGCQIKKTHEGFLSPDEIYHLQEQKNKTKKATQ